MLPLRVKRGDEWATLHLPYAEYPLVLEFFVFGWLQRRLLRPTGEHTRDVLFLKYKVAEIEGVIAIEIQASFNV